MITKKFLKEFSLLNKAQRQAVEAIEGPVIVIAGPGTGKTQILAMRIANILRETQIDAGNILALTFTNSGVWAMKKRLLEIIGPASYKVHVHTFHSFCNEVIQTFPEKFLFNKKLEQINELEQILNIRQIIDETNFTKIKTLKAPYYYQNAILSSIHNLKQENITPQNFAKIVQKELKAFDTIDDLYHDHGPNKDKMKAKYIDQKEQLLKNIELAEAYKKYEVLLKKNGQYDYADMILFVLKSLKHDEELLNYYQEKFQYFLVDEYQDTNNAQNELIQNLVSFYDEPNLFVVGDDEQSIYRFQGAALENILEFIDLYPNAQKIILDQNYRSGQKILDASRSVIKNNTKQIFNILKIEKKLVSQTNNLSKIYLGHFSSNQVEDFFITKTIKKLLKKGIDPSQIACIYKEHRDATELAEILTKSHIPFSQNNSDNILFDNDIEKIINLLQIVHNHDSAIMFEVLHYPFFKISKIDIYRLANVASQHKKSIFEVLTGQYDIEFKNEKSLKNFVKLIFDATTNFANLTFASGFELLANQSSYINYLLKLEDAPIKLNRLKSLFDEIKIINTKHKNLNLKDFLKYIDQLNENNLKIAERPMDANFHGVSLMTAHQAKGLEFEYVFMLHLTDGHWGNKTARRLIKLPQGLLKIQHSPEDNDEEERRLFYVGLTRAKKEIYLSYADSYNESATNSMPSKFITEIDAKNLSKINEKNFEASYTERLKISLRPAVLAPAKDLKKYLEELAEKFVLSATSFNAYQSCPQNFFYNQFLRVPRLKDFNLAYGSAVHYALENFFKKQKNDLSLPSKKFFIELFQEGLDREILTPAETQRATVLGQDILNQYYDFYKDEWSTKIPLACEYNFSFHNVHYDDIPITGKIDKIELIDKTSKKVRIVDYKTTSSKSQNYLLGQTKEADFSYVWQAYFYKLLAENDPLFDWQIAEIEFDFISPTNGKFVKINLPIEDDEYENFKKIVVETYQNILSLKFEPNLENCKNTRHTCDYIKLCN